MIFAECEFLKGTQKNNMKISWNKPCLRVGCVSTRAGLACLSKPNVDCDVIELRLDILRQDDVPLAVIEKALENRKHPALATLRTTDEGGKYPWKSRERAVLFQQLLGKVDAIDLELANARLLRRILRLARQKKCPIILSAHSLRRKLTLRKIERLLREFRGYRAQVYKIASLARTRKDLGLLAQTLITNPTVPLALMAVGQSAALSRIVLPALGSKLVYGYLDEPLFKEQPSIAQVSEVLTGVGIV